MQILLDEPYETTPEDLYPIVQNLINQLLVKWDFLWIDNPQMRIQPDLLTEVVELDGGMKTVTQRQVPATRPKNLLIEFFGYKIGSIQIVQVSRFPSKSRVVIKLRVSEKDYTINSTKPNDDKSNASDNVLNRLGGYNQAFYIMNYLTNGIINLLTPGDQASGNNQSGNKQKLIFQRNGALWNLEFDREKKDLEDYKGMHYIHALLNRPNKEIPSIELYRLGNAISPENIFFPAGKKVIPGKEIIPEYDEGLTISGIDDHYSNLDLSAKEEYQDRLKEIESKLDILIDAGGDSADTYELERERDWIIDALSGEHRNLVIPESEKARQTVTQAIKRAYKKMLVGPHEMTGLVRDLRSTINGGKLFIYQHDENIELEL
jgi:hypothetical protein